VGQVASGTLWVRPIVNRPTVATLTDCGGYQPQRWLPVGYQLPAHRASAARRAQHARITAAHSLDLLFSTTGGSRMGATKGRPLAFQHRGDPTGVNHFSRRNPLLKPAEPPDDCGLQGRRPSQASRLAPGNQYLRANGGVGGW
jgi:hypothetical protein